MISDFFNSSAIVQQCSTTKTGIGSLSRSYSTRIASLPCRIGTKNIREINEFGKLTMRSILRLYCTATATNRAIELTDRITLGSRTFEITGIHNPGQLNRHLQIDLIEVV